MLCIRNHNRPFGSDQILAQGLAATHFIKVMPNHRCITCASAVMMEMRVSGQLLSRAATSVNISSSGFFRVHQSRKVRLARRSFLCYWVSRHIHHILISLSPLTWFNETSKIVFSPILKRMPSGICNFIW